MSTILDRKKQEINFSSSQINDGLVVQPKGDIFSITELGKGCYYFFTDFAQDCRSRALEEYFQCDILP